MQREFQTMMAISEISRSKHLPDIAPIMNSKRMLVLSLGTGAAKNEEKYSADQASEWGLLGWLYDDGNTPILDVYSDANSDMVDIHVSSLFHSFNSHKNYLRIQVPLIHSSIVTNGRTLYQYYKLFLLSFMDFFFLN